MAITVDNGSSKLTFLLFVRAAWHIEGIDLPAVAPLPYVGESHRPEGADADALRTEWSTSWSSAVADLSWERAARPVDTETQARLDAMSFDELLALDDPRRSGTFADGVDLHALAEWDWAAHSRPDLTRLEDQPERVNLAELVPAWRAGLRSITELPFAEDWARRVGSAHLLVAACTRHDRAHYAHALALPVEPVR